MSNPPLSPLSASILCQLLAAPQSGYRLMKTFEETAMGHFSSSLGAIYPALKRMEKAGWIRGERDNPESLRGRRVYRIGKAGKGVLDTWVASPLTREDIIHRMDLILLRFAFMTPLIGRPATIRFLEDLIGHLESYQRELKGQADQMVDVPLEGALALEHGIESYKTTARWARASLKTLTARTNE